MVLGLGAAIAAPIALRFVEDEGMTDLEQAAAYTSGIGGGIALVAWTPR